MKESNGYCDEHGFINLDPKDVDLSWMNVEMSIHPKVLFKILLEIGGMPCDLTSVFPKLNAEIVLQGIGKKLVAEVLEHWVLQLQESGIQDWDPALVECLPEAMREKVLAAAGSRSLKGGVYSEISNLGDIVLSEEPGCYEVVREGLGKPPMSLALEAVTA